MKIHYLQPFAVDKNIGRAYNEECGLVPNDDWICITDHDSCFLHPDSPKQLYDIAENNAGRYSLLCCVTNRLRAPDQLYNRTFSTDTNILNHKAIADKLFATKYAEVSPFPHPAAGLLMLFPKSTWEMVKFKEHRINFDAHFSNEIRQQGGRIGLMEGVYRFHFYRFDKADPFNSINHLLCLEK